MVAPDQAALALLAAEVEMVVVSPGLPAGHPVFSLHSEAEVVGELELGARLTGARLVAVTGTNGKSTITTLVADMLMRSGEAAVAAGNIGLPLVEASGPEWEVIVVEASSFQLALTSTFHPEVALWNNLAPDHLDWHPSLEHYIASKARIWQRQSGADIAVGNLDDPVVSNALASAPALRRTFGSDKGDWHESNGHLLEGSQPVMALSELWRDLPADRLNALAALATATAAGADLESCVESLRNFKGLAHRVELVGEIAGVRYYDDSKATTPDAVLAAMAGLGPVVLIAGGRNKGLSLAPLASSSNRALQDLRAVVCIGESASQLVQVFSGSGVPTPLASSMEEAVEISSSLALAGDSVLLSPGCASFDWYGSYAERGEHFVRCVNSLTAGLAR